ncbi:MAG: hypothetical protein IJB50_00015 [Clostridia bacterium]|nr:hypothetical protein [Clostridia bacterium]
MKYLKTVSLYRYDEQKNVWSVKELKNVLVSGTDKSYNLSDTLNRDAHIILRVMGSDNADILPQDIISFDKTNEKTPPNENIAVVVAVFKNSLGSKRIRHTKVLCK